MSKKSWLIALALGAVGGLVSAAPASAQACVGTRDTFGVCATVDPEGYTLVDDCVYVVFPDCIPVVVYGPSVDCYVWSGNQVMPCS